MAVVPHTQANRSPDPIAPRRAGAGVASQVFSVLGTGGNRHGALGAHGFGDKAASCGFMRAGARRIATGSRHSMVIRTDGSLWVWGQRAGFLPSRVLDQVVACSVDVDESLAMTADDALWQWSLGNSPVRLQLPPAA